MVEPAGFELATPWSQTECSTSCATARHFLRVVSLNPIPAPVQVISVRARRIGGAFSTLCA